ncbi:7TM GPCR serpentine receptor class x (Srx) domain-containing protein [Caenorhabditis elegans]|uniref:7TM GPCR serpentine receptor class x (Srx) domain-containing protein n=1 Tax=Caenorhabditis elegans TaxID=6239 RepID=Q966G9_CAEEL|nr:7TM GPCR serpentine receptor class x (Srx) domain-containing protein [Caenorhabditis elegans]CCD83344.1 7TM GPCR serpentine receptor class x (Srx) domain-containing protein [Caenorhabditis elegans]|eukprot:NP_504893.1 Serpentine Receptor, class X [Caenorhabditis elegans]
MFVKKLVGVVLFSSSIFSIFSSVSIFISVFKLAFISRKSSIYVIAFFNIISDLLQLFYLCFYFSLSIIIDQYAIAGDKVGRLSVFFGFIFLSGWFMENLLQPTMAINRFLVITFNNHNIFTFNKTMLMMTVLISAALFSAACAQYLFPCCVFVIDYTVMALELVTINGVHSYTNSMFLVYDSICTSISIFCYIGVFISIRNSNKKVSTQIQKQRRKQEIRYLLQFMFTSVFYITTWVIFEILQYIIPDKKFQPHAIIPAMIILNCSSNSVIFLSINKEVKCSFQCSWFIDKLGCKKATGNSQVTPVNLI